ncbi:MAG: transglycosylase SLT domain-containing protein [Bacteroidota bacterium]
MKRKMYPQLRVRGSLITLQKCWSLWKSPYWNLGWISLLSYHLYTTQVKTMDWNQFFHGEEQLYLMQDARRFIPEVALFSDKVKDVSQKLQVPPEWLMAIMKAESGFNPAVRNRKGSGAVGLIQFMPVVAQEMDVQTSDLARMQAHHQMEYVCKYLQVIRSRYGEYQSLTDLYLGVLYPKARYQDPCYVLYAKPSNAYKQNRGLDENGDGVVSVYDIDLRLKRLFPEAYGIEKKNE